MGNGAVYAGAGIAALAVGIGAAYYLWKRSPSGPKLTASPQQGPSGTSVAFRVSGATTNGPVSIVYSATPDPSGQIAPSQYTCLACVVGTADAAGNWSTTDTLSDTGSGNINFYAAAYDHTTGNYGGWVQMAVTPALGGGSGSGSGGGCGLLQVQCGSSCGPLGDVCAPCPPGYIPDPAFPGFCKNGCPGSCSQDADCTLCGSGFVCEAGQCQQQVIQNVSSPLTEDLTFTVDYDESCCFYVVTSTCKACNQVDGPASGISYASWTVTVTDKHGRPVPGVRLSAAATNPSVGVGLGGQGLSVDATDQNGQVQVQVWIARSSLPYPHNDDTNLPCSQCSGHGDLGSWADSLGQINYMLPDYPSVYAGQTLLTSHVNFNGTGGSNCVGNCL